MVSHHCIGDPTAMVAQQVPVKMHDDDARWVLPKKPHRGSFITAVSFIVAISHFNQSNIEDTSMCF